MQRTSTYSTPRSRSACSGRSPLRDHALGPDRAVELVLDLQQAGGQLVVFAARVADADRLVRRVRLGQRLVQRRAVALEVVVAHRQRRLRVALVAEPAHAQRRARAAGAACAATAAAGRARGRRRSSSTPRATRRTAYSSTNEWRRKLRISAKYSSLADAGQRPVVVDARDRLHAPAVAMPQAHAVDALGVPDVGRAVAADRNRLVGRAGRTACSTPTASRRRIAQRGRRTGGSASAPLEAGLARRRARR